MVRKGCATIVRGEIENIWSEREIAMVFVKNKGFEGFLRSGSGSLILDLGFILWGCCGYNVGVCGFWRSWHFWDRNFTFLDPPLTKKKTYFLISGSHFFLIAHVHSPTFQKINSLNQNHGNPFTLKITLYQDQNQAHLKTLPTYTHTQLLTKTLYQTL